MGARLSTDRRTFLVGSASLALAGIGCGGASERTDGAGGAAGGAPPSGAGGDPATGAGGAGAGAGAGGHTPADSGTAGGAGPVGDAALCPPTRTDIEGPFFVPASPERTDLLEVGMAGQRLRFGGRVLGPDCEPVANAILDFWQADDAGAYDNAGFRLRGHQRASATGEYRLSTIVPGRYLNGAQYRPAHIHVKVYVGEREVLTTQLYFAGDPYNAVDPWFSEETMLVPVDQGGVVEATFDFAIPA
jgi:hypothetical protein